mgnify:CR=1 FL=1
MNLTSIRIITDNVDRLVNFYETITGFPAERPAPVFAELVLPGCTLAIGHSTTAQLFSAGSPDAIIPAHNRSVLIEFRVEDIEAEYIRLQPLALDWIQEPTTMPWGNRSMVFRDPDGNLVNYFEPVTEEAIQRFKGRESFKI